MVYVHIEQKPYTHTTPDDFRGPRSLRCDTGSVNDRSHRPVHVSFLVTCGSVPWTKIRIERVVQHTLDPKERVYSLLTTYTPVNTPLHCGGFVVSKRHRSTGPRVQYRVCGLGSLDNREGAGGGTIIWILR